MPAYLVTTYDVTDPETYAKFNPGGMSVILKTIAKHGGKVLSAGRDSHWEAGERTQLVILEFPDVDAGKAWLNDDDYKALTGLRDASTSNRVEAIAPGYIPRQ